MFQLTSLTRCQFHKHLKTSYWNTKHFQSVSFWCLKLHLWSWNLGAQTTKIRILIIKIENCKLYFECYWNSVWSSNFGVPSTKMGVKCFIKLTPSWHSLQCKVIFLYYKYFGFFKTTLGLDLCVQCPTSLSKKMDKEVNNFEFMFAYLIDLMSFDHSNMSDQVICKMTNLPAFWRWPTILLLNLKGP